MSHRLQASRICILVCHGFCLPLCLGVLCTLTVPVEEDGRSKHELVATEASKHQNMDDSNL